MGLRKTARGLAATAVVLTLALAGQPLWGQDGTPQISTVRIAPTKGAAEVRLQVSGSTQDLVISDFPTTEPPGVVVDVVGLGVGDVQVPGASGDLVKSVLLEPDAERGMTRVRLILSEAAGYTVTKESGAVVIRLTAGATAGSDPLAQALGGGGSLDDQVQRGQAAGAVSGPSAVDGAALSSLDFENLDSVSRVVIGTNGAMAYTSSQPEPNLVVVDIPGAQLPESLERPLDTSNFISPVRMVRAYRTRDGVRVAVSLRRTTEWKVVAGPDNLLYVDVAVPADMIQDRETAKQGFSTAAPSEPEQAGTSQVLIGADGKTSDPRQVFGTGQGAQSPGSVMAGSGAFVLNTASASTSNYTGQRINLDLVDADIHSVFRLISHVSNLNVVAGDDVNGKVTVRLIDVPWDQALAAILQAKGLGAQQFGNIVRIAPIETIKAEQQAAVEAQNSEFQLQPLKMLVVQLNYADADELVQQLSEFMSERGTVQVEERSNQLIIQDIEERLAMLRELLRTLDRPTPQVLIEARIVETSTAYTKDLGVQWGGQIDASALTGFGTGLFFPNSVGISGGQTTGQQAREVFFQRGQENLAVDLAPAGTFGSLALSLGSVSGLINLDARFAAMESDGWGEVISSPKVLTMDNTAARIRQGARIPFLTASAQGTQVQFIQAALEMEVTPHITSDNKIFLQLSISNNRADFSQSVNGQPAILIKEAETQLLVADGDTVVIGGVYASEDGDAVNRIPFISRIPLLGKLFQQRTIKTTRSEMLVFVTPRIVTRSK